MTDWPHAPVHRLAEPGAYMVTGATYQKAPYFHSPARLTLLRDALFRLAEQYGWALQAWAIMSNHYHFVALSPAEPATLRKMTRHLHSLAARDVNRLDGTHAYPPVKEVEGKQAMGRF